MLCGILQVVLLANDSYLAIQYGVLYLYACTGSPRINSVYYYSDNIIAVVIALQNVVEEYWGKCISF